jgi:hypothetical protein
LMHRHHLTSLILETIRLRSSLKQLQFTNVKKITKNVTSINKHSACTKLQCDLHLHETYLISLKSLILL